MVKENVKIKRVRQMNENEPQSKIVSKHTRHGQLNK